MRGTLLITAALFAGTSAFGADQATVRVEPAKLQGPRQLQEQTGKAVIQDYLQSWETLKAALEQNRPDLLDRDFVGSAKEKLANTIQEQNALGVHTNYADRSHHLQILFYSPEGLSIQLADNVEYDVQIFDHDKAAATQKVRARYIVILTPSEVRWRVRVFQAVAD